MLDALSNLIIPNLIILIDLIRVIKQILPLSDAQIHTSTVSKKLTSSNAPDLYSGVSGSNFGLDTDSPDRYSVVLFKLSRQLPG